MSPPAIITGLAEFLSWTGMHKSGAGGTQEPSRLRPLSGCSDRFHPPTIQILNGCKSAPPAGFNKSTSNPMVSFIRVIRGIRGFDSVFQIDSLSCCERLAAMTRRMRSLLIPVFLISVAAFVRAESYDLLIRGGRLVDGTGNPAYFADVAVQDGRIAAIGKLAGGATTTLEVPGL